MDILRRGKPKRSYVLSEVSHERPWKIDISHLKIAARSTRWKVIYNAKGNVFEVYDLIADPSERENLFQSLPNNEELRTLFLAIKRRIARLRVKIRIKALRKIMRKRKSHF